jgi:RNA-dependent RNA polymerase
MVLEDLGVKADAFIELQDAVKAQISTAIDSLEDIPRLLQTYTLGGPFHLAFIFDQLTKLGLGPRNTFEKIAFGNAFLGRLLHGSAQHMLRGLKHKAQIPVPKSYQLVGVADEGQAYIKEGMDPDTVYTLKEGFIYGTRPRSSAVRTAHSWDCTKSVFKRPLTRNQCISKALV